MSNFEMAQLSHGTACLWNINHFLVGAMLTVQGYGTGCGRKCKHVRQHHAAWPDHLAVTAALQATRFSLSTGMLAARTHTRSGSYTYNNQHGHAFAGLQPKGPRGSQTCHVAIHYRGCDRATTYTQEMVIICDDAHAGHPTITAAELLHGLLKQNMTWQIKWVHTAGPSTTNCSKREQLHQTRLHQSGFIPGQALRGTKELPLAGR